MAPGKARRGRRRGRPSADTQTAKPPGSSLDNLLSRAKQCEERGDVDQALSTLDKALELHPGNAMLYEETAILCMQAGQHEKALRLFQSAIAEKPDSGFEKYAYLSQLLGNSEEALDVARRGIQIMRTELVSLDERTAQQRIAELRGYEASAHCAVAEICLGIIEDSNDPQVARRLDPDVEKAVTAALGLSEEGSNSQIEAMLSLANLRLSQGRRDDATESMKRIVYRLSEGLAKLENGDNSDATVVAALGMLPPLEIRIAVGKQLIEVELWMAAVSTLASVMWECDFNVEVWYLLAVAYWKLGDVQEARSALENTRAVLHNPDGFEGQLEDEMVDKLYKELDSQHGIAKVEHDAMQQ